MTIAEKIEAHVRAAFDITEFEAINDSHKHAGHAGDNGTGESHFRIVVTSPVFDGMSRVASHRMVMDAVKPLFDKGLHALSVKTKTP